MRVWLYFGENNTGTITDSLDAWDYSPDASELRAVRDKAPEYHRYFIHAVQVKTKEK